MSLTWTAANLAFQGKLNVADMKSCAVGQDTKDYKIAVYGAAGVGKSSLVQRFVNGTFKDAYVPTIEDTYRKVINSNQTVCTLQVTDTTGSHQFPAMQKLSIQKSHAFLLVYATNNQQSLTELKAIYDDIVDIKGGIDMNPVMLVGNKCDDTHREVLETEGKTMSKQWGCAFLETSAKNNYNVQEVFEQLLLLEKRRNITLDADKKAKQKSKSARSSKRVKNIKNKCVLM